jgi:hypothetical protein
MEIDSGEGNVYSLRHYAICKNDIIKSNQWRKEHGPDSQLFMDPDSYGITRHCPVGTITVFLQYPHL